MAGGFTQQSKHSQVVLFRRVSPDLVESHVIDVKQMLKRHNLDEDVYLQPGDYVFVPRSLVSNIMRFMPTTNLGMYSSPTRF
jgi:protein involved in polysaccharide export with SLBB domain